MRTAKKYLAIIPAKKNSSFAGKNLFPINSIPMIRYTLEAASKVPDIDILVTSNSNIFMEESSRFKTFFDLRNDSLCNDHATLDHVMTYYAVKHPDFNSYENYICLPPTSPLRNETHIKCAIKIFESNPYDSLLSVTQEKKSIWKVENSELRAVRKVENINRQYLQPYYIANGAIFITKRNILERFSCKIGGRIGTFLMFQKSSVDVHNEDDIALAEYYLKEDTAP